MRAKNGWSYRKNSSKSLKNFRTTPENSIQPLRKSHMAHSLATGPFQNSTLYRSSRSSPPPSSNSTRCTGTKSRSPPSGHNISPRLDKFHRPVAYPDVLSYRNFYPLGRIAIQDHLRTSDRARRGRNNPMLLQGLEWS